ncbi:hypothetical protein [Armatimonas rosea]|uniref:Outer membrane protein beta-barrel domain-containing protein n=1 Tax=Armatimonas rosea TaxID=685828 RepID=A0A7W9W867_ARMRO|nr:hypothetical protein [Armatimonas rosea]MBB6051825.1 hypothetical protein [Armatimonas rosea]
MKSHLLALSLALLTTPALAQSRPFRMTLGGSTAPTRDLFWFGASLDTKRLTPQRTLSLYAESAFSLGSGSGTSADPNAPPSAETMDGFGGVGFSVRQSRGYGWVGVGLGSYLTTFSGGGAGTRKRTELGGKVFAGVGGGLYFTELTLTLPSVTQPVQAGISVGFRL